MLSIAGSIAGSLVSSALSGGGDSGGGTSFKPFTPVNFYTPSGNVGWNGTNGKVTLPSDLNGLRSDYIGQAGNYNSSIDSFYGPSASSFYHTNSGYTPKSYDYYYGKLAPKYTSASSGGAFGGKNALYSSSYGMPGYWGFGLGYKSGGVGSSVNQSGLDAAIRDAMARDQAANSTFDQAGYDSARAAWQSPEQRMYSMMTALSKPGEDQARTDLESRLFAQGQLGASNGQGYNPAMKAFDDSSQQAQIQRELTALTSTPQLLSQYQNLFNSAVTGANNIDANAIDLLKTSGNIGVGAGSNSINGANVQNQINQGSGNFWGSAAGSIGNAVAQGVNGMFNTNPIINNYSPYTAYTPTGGPGVNLSGYDPFAGLTIQ